MTRNWWIAILFLALSVISLFIFRDSGLPYLFWADLVLLALAAFLSMVIAFILIIEKKILLAFITLAGTGISAVIALFIIFWPYFSFLIDGDHWADDLKIPEGIQIEEPIESSGYDYTFDSAQYKADSVTMILYNGPQPGMYVYDFYSKNIPVGHIYLKAFEITGNYALSEDELKKNSRLEVRVSSETYRNYGPSGTFTIYEGDWGKFYAARFEVWSVPEHGGKEMKIFEKNYKIQGWMH